MESIRHTPSLILASASPRRRELLHQAGVPFTVLASGAPELLAPGEEPAAFVLRVAREKAVEVASRSSNRWVLAADTIVVIEGTILGKPQNKEDAQGMLQRLSGKSHQVMTAFVLLAPARTIFHEQVVTSTVTFKPLSDSQIRNYLATGEPFDKAGAYAVQGLGAMLVKQVEGSYTNVVGLPIDETVAVLRRARLLPEHL